MPYVNIKIIDANVTQVQKSILISSITEVLS
jgi:phenylpyruvate tautomerase PptA (4-oxalocrotonate tautomerase family)